MMLDHMGFMEESKRIKDSVKTVIGEGKWVTRDLGGSSGTKEFEKAIIDNL